MDDKAKQRIMTDLTDLDEKDVLAVLESLRLIREETGWGNTLVVLKGGTIDEVVTTISRRGSNLKT